MKFGSNSADASHYFHEDATAEIARMDTSAVHGNIADAMKNAVVLTGTTQLREREYLERPLQGENEAFV